jgi:RNA polymerase sigma-70 factor (ECF subfamily)
MNREGNVASLDELLAHAGWARRLAVGLAGDAAAAEDAVQDTWIAAWQARPSGDQPLARWIGAVVKRRLLRSRLADQRRRRRDAEAAAALPAVPTPDELAGRVKAQRLLAELVQGLDEPYRQAVLLRYYEELSAAEIGRRLGVPAGTIRWRLKVGLDRLRAELARRRGGDREVWLPALSPLLPEGRMQAPSAMRAPGRASRLLLAASLGAVGMATLGLGLARLREGRPPTSSPPAPALPAARLAVADAGAAGERQAPATLSACLVEVTRLREQVAVAENEALWSVLPPRLFERGEANPQAEAQLAPALARMFAGDAGAALSRRLECRSWACRLTVLDDQPRRAGRWQALLQNDREIGFASPRVRHCGLRSGGKVRDPASGAIVVRFLVYFTLADPSGRPMTYRPPAGGPGRRGKLPLVARPAEPLPPTLGPCRAEALALGARLASALADVEENLDPLERFAKAAPDPGLSAEITAEMRRVLATSDPAYRAECRADVCQFRGPEPAHVWRRTLSREEGLGWRLGGMQSELYSPLWFATVKSDAELESGRWLQAKLDELAGTARERCAREHPQAAGKLDVRLAISLLGQGSAAGTTQELSAEYGHELAATPVGACVAAALERALATTQAPATAVAAQAHRVLSFPAGP